ncbi:unnamed protein product [Rotaria sp. Silwood1]|nr:unnamed protein product [Rotaria sp. Silwood1]CAF3759796.1 unnamed protein product [Rotaria sp. Silwood1]CAF4900491.1 unnamed protein product [Rotaria sp. Silwood1]
MANTMIEVHFKQTGESFNVPVSLRSTVETIIKYVCENSVLTKESSYANSSNKPAPTQCTTQFGTERKKAPPVPPKPSSLLKSNAISESPRNNVSSTIPPEKVSPTSSLKNTSHLTNEELKPLDTPKFIPTSTNLKPNMSDSCSASSLREQPIQEEVAFHKAKPVSNDDVKDLSLTENLADTYESVTSKIHKIGAAATRDPIIRRDIATTFKEINIVLCGSPRVGKSTLINAICQQTLAKTSPGLDACTHGITRYYLAGNIKTDSGTINYEYNFWDTPGLESWSQEDIRRHLENILKKPKSDILCMIYCASPGSFANLEKLNWLLKECMNRQIFCALVCTNKYGGQAAQRNAVMEDFQRLLEHYHVKTREENGVIYFGNMGLCTAVNSQKFVDDYTGRTFEESGIDELILGIMESLDEEKVAQWCMVAFENKSFWKNVFKFPAQLKAFWNRLIGRA